MSRIINIYDLSIELENLICIRINHNIDIHKIIFQYKQRVEYTYNPESQEWVKQHLFDTTTKIFLSFNEARDAYEAFILEWTRYKEGKGRYYPLFDSIDVE